jgi:hypothetical protein
MFLSIAIMLSKLVKDCFQGDSFSGQRLCLVSHVNSHFSLWFLAGIHCLMNILSILFGFFTGQVLHECLKDKIYSGFLPFFWMHVQVFAYCLKELLNCNVRREKNYIIIRVNNPTT